MTSTRSVRPGSSAVASYQGGDYLQGDPDVTVIVLEGARGEVHFTATGADGRTTVSMHGPRGGQQGSFEVNTQSLRDLAEAFRLRGLT